MPLQVPLPSKDTKVGICVWDDLSLADVNALYDCQGKDDVRRKLATIMELQSPTESLKDDILVDLYYFLFLYCCEQKFNQEQTSALFSILRKTHEKAMESPFGNVDDTFTYFKELLLCHAVKRPPFSVLIFSMAQVQSIRDYVLDSYFRHFKLYKYAFTPKVALNLTIEYKGIPKTPEVQQEPDEMEEGDNTQLESVEKPVEEKTSPPEEPDSPAVMELKSMVSEAINKQMKDLRVSLDVQLKETEEALTKKVAQLTGEEGKAASKVSSRPGSTRSSKNTKKK